MEHQLAKVLSLDNSAKPSEVSQPVSMAGANAAQGATVIQILTATSVEFQLQESNDLENWSDKGSAQTVAAANLGYTLLTAITSISAAYVRMKYTLNGTGKAILALTLSVTQQ
ncbi:MAG: hypothetical protein R3F56_10475 [Planctomycetota bacterium]